MKFVVSLLALVALANASVEIDNTAYGYLEKYGIPEAERIRQAEELGSRIIGGVPATLGQYPWQVGLLIDIIGLDGVGVCGASLVSASRVVTAAHCWTDGVNQGWRFTVVLGSIHLFSGGTRVETSAIAVHPNWLPLLARNDIGVIYLPNPVTFSNTIAPVSLPSGSELEEDFAGEPAIASGFGITSNGGSISANQGLSHVRLQVITNSICRLAFPLILQDGNICTSGVGVVGTCRGDSGGPLIAVRNNRNILIGVTSFGSGLGCEANLPSAYARVTSYIDFLNQHIQT